MCKWMSGVAVLALVSAGGSAMAGDSGLVSRKLEIVMDCGILAGTERLSVTMSAPETMTQGLLYTLTFQDAEGVVPKRRGPIKIHDIHDIELTLSVRPGARIVPGSLTLEGGTNVGETSHFIDSQRNQLTYVLGVKGTRFPAGMRYTPPLVRWQVWNEAPPGTELRVRIERVSIRSRSSLGEKRVVCSPARADSDLAFSRSVAPPR